MSFMSSMREAADAANTATTTAGGADALVRAKQAAMYFGKGRQGFRNAVSRFGLSSGHSAMKEVPGLPGSKAIGTAGAALSLFGLGTDLYDMSKNGIGVDNTLSALTNASGVVSTVVPAAGALSAGLEIGQRGDKRLGLSDKASDAGRWVYEKLGRGVLGHAGGGLTTALGTAASAPAAAVAGIYDLGESAVGAVEGAGRAALGLDHPLLAGVRQKVASARQGADR